MYKKFLVIFILMVGIFFANNALAVNGACSSPATHYVCAAGTSTSNIDQGTYWSWTCTGNNYGTNAVCTENKPVLVNGACSSPATHYVCAAGTSTSNAETSSAYTWTCTGSNYGTNATCSEAKPAVNGACSSPATHYVCITGTSTFNAETSSAWTWTCSSSNYGISATCTQNKTISSITSSSPVANTTVVTGNSGSNYGVIVPYNARAFYLYNNGNLLDSVTISSSCDSNNHWNGSICTPNVTPINGSCGSANGGSFPSAPSSNLCSTGTASVVTGSGPSWAWSCQGSGTGHTDESCFADKVTTLPDLTAGSVTPTMVTVGTALTFYSTISNIGNASTGASFHNFFQVKDSSGNITDLASTSMSTLASGASNTATSPSYTFLSTGTYSARACADKTSSAGGGVITEPAPSPLGEFNNCGDWTTITVSAPGTPIPGSCAANHYFCASPGTSINHGEDAISWTWTCPGFDGGANSSCSEPKVPGNGSCSAAHYLCSVGTSVNNVDGATAWTWDCNGSDGGTNASCSQSKTKKPGYKEN